MQEVAERVQTGQMRKHIRLFPLHMRERIQTGQNEHGMHWLVRLCTEMMVMRIHVESESVSFRALLTCIVTSRSEVGQRELMLVFVFIVRIAMFFTIFVH